MNSVTQVGLAGTVSSTTTAPVCWMNGRLLPAAEARISVFDHGLLYGDGVFEGLRFYNGHVFRLARHLTRLQASAAALRLTLPYNVGALDLALRELIDAFDQPDGYVRLVVTRGEGRLGLDPSSCTQPNLFIIADKLQVMPERVQHEGARVIVAATRRLPADGLDPRVKSLNYLNHVLARMEAGNAGADEAILLNAVGHVTEGSTDNIFVVRDGVLRTPPASDGALEGVTREAVVELAWEHDIPVRIESLTPYDLYTADECFLTGTAVELIPVREVDRRVVKACPGPVFQTLRSAFERLIERETNHARFNSEANT